MAQSPYQRYPMVMTHPHEKRATITPIMNPNSPMRPDYQGSPERFPPVTVNNEDQEAMHAAMGYIGSGDPIAYERVTANPIVNGHVFVEYPKWVNGQIVNSREEEAKLRSVGMPDEDDNESELPTWDSPSAAQPPESRDWQDPTAPSPQPLTFTVDQVRDMVKLAVAEALGSQPKARKKRADAGKARGRKKAQEAPSDAQRDASRTMAKVVDDRIIQDHSQVQG